jgi:hypothetical protein
MCIFKKREKRTIKEYVNSAMTVYQKDKSIEDKRTYAEKGYLRIFGSLSIIGYDNLSRKGNSNRKKSNNL